ncbi:MAG TPA: cytochrome c oxidase subunit 3 [Polyangia bacterium]
MSLAATALGPGRREASASRGPATATIGMAIFLGAAAMLFAAMFFAYGVMRAQAPAWPPPGQAPLPRGALGANTLLLAAASLVLRAALAAARRGNAARARTRAGAALGLGAAFLVAQIVVWRALVLGGAGPTSGIYGSVFFAISGLHALHVFGGLLALAVVLARGASSVARTERRLALAALYWDFVLAVWLLFFFGACLR